MTENYTNIYDIFHPSPPTLKHLAQISITLELWRREIDKYRATNTLEDLELQKTIPTSELKPLLPSSILKDIEEYTFKVGESIHYWLEGHCQAILDFHRDDANEILRDFDDFVCDFDGDIHFSRTAKRMILSDRFSIDEKFKIACTHCFEDDIVRMWPSVKTRVNLDGVDFHKHAILYYWICRLTNQLEKIPGFYSGSGRTVEEAMFSFSSGSTWSRTSVDYLWNRLNPVDRWRSAKDLYEKNERIFSRYVLAKLNEKEIDKLIAEGGDDYLLAGLLLGSEMRYILPTWTLMKHKLNESSFILIAELIFEHEANFRHRKWTSVGREIWESAPNNLKQVVIRDHLPNTSLFVRQHSMYIKFRIVSFLIAVLRDITIEERSEFWNKNWPTLIVGCKTEDLNSLMHLCLKNETEIIQFKESTLSKYENIRPQCSKLLEDGCFKELKKFATFCSSTEQAGRDIMVKVLINDLKLNTWHISDPEIFDNFIKDAFNHDEEEIRKFKINLSSSLDASDCVVRTSILHGEFRSLMNFIDRFVVSKKKAVYLKRRYFPFVFTRHLTIGIVPRGAKHDELSSFMQWCFENNEREIAKFKRTLSMDELIDQILRYQIRIAKECTISDRRPARKRRRASYSSDLDKLLEWYFVTPEDVEKWKIKCAELFESLSEELADVPAE